MFEISLIIFKFIVREFKRHNIVTNCGTKRAIQRIEANKGVLVHADHHHLKMDKRIF